MLPRFTIVVLLVSALAACAAPPTSELEDAKGQVAAAEQAEAADFAADVLGDARKLLADAEAEVERQQKAFGPGRSYDSANELIAAAVAKAKQAAETASKVKTMVEEQASTHLADLGAGLSTSRELIERLRKCGRRSWRGKIDLEESGAWLDALESRLADIKSAVDSGALKRALEGAQAAVLDLREQQGALEEAAASSGC